MKDRLIRLCAALGLSQREFCRRIGVDDSFVRKANTSISTSKVAAIKSAFPCVNVTWLTTGEGEPLSAGVCPDGAASAAAEQQGSDVARRVREVVERRGCGVARFARAAGVKQSTLSACINVLSEPRAGLLQGVLRAAPDVSARWLLMGDGEATVSTMHVSNSQGVTQSGNVMLGTDERVAELETQLRALLKLIADK